MGNMQRDVDVLVAALLGEHRLRRDVDYAIAAKYGRIRLMCGSRDLSTIRSEAMIHAVPLDFVSVWDSVKG